jgi:magnesium chelatase family protein
MLALTKSMAVLGIDAYVVDIEADASHHVPAFTIVGLPDNAVRESRERVMAAIKNAGFHFPPKKMTINLAPADIKKEGSSFDLPIALGILMSTDQLLVEKAEKLAVLGELSLDGDVRKVPGVLSMAIAARQRGFQGIIVPEENAREAAVARGLKVYPVKSLRQVTEHLNGGKKTRCFKIDINKIFLTEKKQILDFQDVKGQEHVKRALEVAVSGGHNIIMIGPPGSGKTMLARRIPSIMPDLTIEESLETTKIHSVAGKLPPDTALVNTRPFRSPHHTISDCGLIGGGSYPRPGEVSLAHHGVLFLDELPEFKKHVLEVMRQPIEDGQVTISRAAMSLTYPARFMLVASLNPCPCGHYMDPGKHCRCTAKEIGRYMSRISGPLMDRIDIQIEVPSVNYQDLSSHEPGETSKDVQKRVNRVREIQQKRFEKEQGVFCNAHMETKQINRFCALADDGHELLKRAIMNLGLSARAYDRIKKVSRTIADMEGEIRIQAQHVAEAIQYRSLDRQLWLNP